jgi:hypothetical protein
MARASAVSAAAVCCGLLIGCDSSRSGPTSPATRPADDPSAAREPAFHVAATALAQEAVADPKAAEAKYRGQWVEVDGRIDLANRVLGDSRMVSLVGTQIGPDKSIAVNVLCLSVPNHRAEMWWLGKGERVTVVGRVSNVSPEAVYLDECTFTEREPNPTPTTTAEQLAGEFAHDAGAAKKKYQPVLGEKYGREVIVTGTVANLTRTRNGLYIAQLAGAARLTVNCHVPKEEWQSLKRGEEVTVKGDYANFAPEQSAIVIDSAFVLKKSAPAPKKEAPATKKS